MRRAPAPPGLAPDPVEARALRARRRGERLVAVLVERDVVARDHVWRPLAGLRELELPNLGLDVPGVVGAPFHPGPAQPDGARARQPPVLDRVSCAEDEVVEPIGPALERVLVVVGDLDDGVPRSNLADRLVLPEQSGAAEHVEDFLREAMRMRRRRKPAGIDANAVEPEALGPRRVAEPLPGGRHRPLLGTTPLDFVPVREHESSISEAGGTRSHR